MNTSRVQPIEFYLQRHFPVQIRELTEGEGGGWHACIPALGEKLFVGDGDTIEEALENLEDFRVALLTDMYERGEEMPDPPDNWDADQDYSGIPGLRVPKSLHRELAERAKSEEVSLNQYLTNVLYRHIGHVQTLEAVREYLDPWIAPSQPQERLREEACRLHRMGGRETYSLAA